ncbi:hypothetical protein PanWU01x14_023210 [Parasponia andersonii]|uniref:Uncharacterized protein n=1 Tax=Parasponia andersonii TaxID=3476 RepID=A0A2P5DXF0_PARAD|nr:hypothetical protein PanWU01x14_023210 [Parasponia andersonii]
MMQCASPPRELRREENRQIGDRVTTGGSHAKEEKSANCQVRYPCCFFHCVLLCSVPIFAFSLPQQCIGLWFCGGDSVFCRVRE